MVVFSDEHGQLPPRHHRRGWEPLLHGPASPGVSASVVRRTPPAQLQRGHSGLPRSHVYGPWPGQVRGQRGDTPQPDGAIEQTAQVALTSLCESRLLFPIRNQADTVWKQHLEAMSNPEGPHFHSSMTVLAKFVQHMFNL
jgi:hypothetical protein